MTSEEQYARRLLKALERLPVAGVQLSVEGSGVHWHCEAQRGGRSCRVHCFDYPGVEYLVSFEADGQSCAEGRTQANAEVVDAVADWLGGCDVIHLYRRFVFVDRRKRALRALASEVVRLQPALTVGEVRHDMSDLYRLWFTTADRACKVSFYGDNEFPDAVFHWDGCELFQFAVGEVAAFAAVLARWLSDRAMPSALRAEFPWLEIGPLADAYEAGRGTEGEFQESWDGIERHFSDGYGPGPQVLSLIAAIRAAGYDRKLRAGQSMYTLIVSRSRRHGLRRGQPKVAFEFEQGGMQVYVGEQRLNLPRVEFDPRVEAILRDLAAQPID
jgi:hypothetical protein